MNIQYTKYFFAILLLSSFCRSQKLLLLMIDGFRWDYYENMKEKLPGLTQFIAEGVQAQWVEPIFPSLTFPSMSTIATGVFPENHGILTNFLMNRSSTDENEKYLDKTSPRKNQHQWLQVEPIWITTTKHNMKTYVANWPFCAFPFKGLLPEKVVDFNPKLPHNITTFEKELEISLNLLTNDYSLAMQYYSRIDAIGHPYGPNSPEVQEAIINFDKTVTKLIHMVQNSNIANELNIIIIGDHGMTDISRYNNIYLAQYVNQDYIDKVVSLRSILMFAAAKNCKEKLYRQMEVIPGVDVYRKEEILNEFHFKDNYMMLDILLVARPGYAVLGLSAAKQVPADDKIYTTSNKGDHGYYNLTDMRTVFLARGPAFKKGYLHTPIRLEDEYQIFAKVLEIPTLPHNGSWARVAPMFIK